MKVLWEIKTVVGGVYTGARLSCTIGWQQNGYAAVLARSMYVQIGLPESSGFSFSCHAGGPLSTAEMC